MILPLDISQRGESIRELSGAAGMANHQANKNTFVMQVWPTIRAFLEIVKFFYDNNVNNIRFDQLLLVLIGG